MTRALFIVLVLLTLLSSCSAPAATPAAEPGPAVTTSDTETLDTPEPGTVGERIALMDRPGSSIQEYELCPDDLFAIMAYETRQGSSYAQSRVVEAADNCGAELKRPSRGITGWIPD